MFFVFRGADQLTVGGMASYEGESCKVSPTKTKIKTKTSPIKITSYEEEICTMSPTKPPPKKIRFWGY